MTGTLLYLHGLTIDGRDGAVLRRALPGVDVVAPDLPGHGHTPPAPDWHPRALALGLALPEGPFAVVGHSWGAALAAWLAAERPERVTALVLLDGGWFDRADLPRRSPPRAAHQAAALEALFAVRTSACWPALARAAFPVLAVAATHGDADGAHTRRLAAFAEAVPRARTHALPDVGHDLLRDAPEATGAVVAAFLSDGPVDRVP